MQQYGVVFTENDDRYGPLFIHDPTPSTKVLGTDMLLFLQLFRHCLDFFSALESVAFHHRVID